MPPESILLPISTHLPHFLNKRMPKLQARDSGLWWGTLGKLQLMLRKASQVFYLFQVINALNLTFRHSIQMETSLLTRCTTTEWQSQRGRWSMAVSMWKMSRIMSFFTPGPDKKSFQLWNIHFYFPRILKNINLQNLKRASAFIDIQDR